MNPGEISDGDKKSLVEVLVSDDSMTGYIKMTKPDQDQKPVTREMLNNALKASNVCFGLKEGYIEKLAERPIYNIRIEVANGTQAVDGEDGELTYLVKKDSEYKPEYSLDGIIDYKNIDYFQLVKKDQLLCIIKKETPGKEGMNIFGGVIPARNGRPPYNPLGKNTVLIEDDTKLIAACDGVVRFVRDSVDINDMLMVKSDVGQLTGNVKFSGDITIDGDICDGFSVTSGGNVIVKGVVEDATIEASGNVHISKGVNGGGDRTITVGGNLKCKYIENAIINVDGNISADYIIDSRVACYGNIELSGARELIVGGEVKVLGELYAKDIGSETERITKIEVLGVKIFDTEGIEKLKKQREELNAAMLILAENFNKVNQLIKKNGTNIDLMDELALIRKKNFALKEQIDSKSYQIQKLEANWTMEYPGSITCKRKLYRGVKIVFGEEKFNFDLTNIEHCRIFWADREIIQGTL